MAEHRPFPPSSRRLALARRAGLHAASPVIVAAAAWIGVLVAALATARGLATTLGAWIAAACDGRADIPGVASAGPSRIGDGPSAETATTAAGAFTSAAATHPTPLDAPNAIADAFAATAAAGHAAPLDVPAASVDVVAPALLELAGPIVAAAAIAAIAAHLAQTRALWIPQRRIAGAPQLAGGPGPRSVRAGLDLAGAAVLGVIAFGWLWLVAPRLSAVVALSPRDGLAATAALGASFASAAAIGVVALGVVDALVRRAGVMRALAMTSAEKREDDRLATADPRWRARRRAIARSSPSEGVAGASVLLLGDDAAVAVAWDPQRRPIPVRTATGRRARATQLLGLARRHRVPVHRDPGLAAALVDGDGPVPERDWPRLAEIIAAVRSRGEPRSG